MYGFPSELQISEVGQQQALQVPKKEIVFRDDSSEGIPVQIINSVLFDG